MAKRILHVIDTLSRGGAEVLLKNTTDILPEYEHTVIYLFNCTTPHLKFNKNVEIICLNHNGWKTLVSTVFKLRKIVTQKKPTLIHSHLLISTLIARLAVSKKTPLFSTIHSTYSIDAFQSRIALWVERLTVRKHHRIIAVSKAALQDYLNLIQFHGQTFVLYNFVPENFFTGSYLKNTDASRLRCIAIGNLKEAKNYHYLVEVFKYLKNLPITLDIYGEGMLMQPLEKEVANCQLGISLKGPVDNIYETLKEYDLFIQASLHEGYGISVMEAAATRIPLFLSEIPVFKEITQNAAYFFPLEDASTVAEKLVELQKNPYLRMKYIEKAYHVAKENASEKGYKNTLTQIYNDI